MVMLAKHVQAGAMVNKLATTGRGSAEDGPDAGLVRRGFLLTLQCHFR